MGHGLHGGLQRSLLGCGAGLTWVSAERWEVQAGCSSCHFPIRGWILGSECPKVSPANPRTVKQEVDQEPWSDLRSRKVGLQSLGGSSECQGWALSPGEQG